MQIFQQTTFTLNWSLAASVSSAKRILHHLLPGPEPELCTDLTLVKPAPPGPSHHWSSVSGVISHRVERLPGLEPLLHGRHLPGADPAVQVSAEEDGDLRVQGGQEPPVRAE